MAELALRGKRAEEALRASEERFRGLVEAVTDYVYTVRIDRGEAVETQHGPGSTAVTGYTEDDFRADPMLWHRMVLPEDRQTVEEQARRILAGEKVGAIEHRITHKDGRVRWIRNTPLLRRDAAGRLISFQGLIRDITDYRLAEEALGVSEARWRALAEHAPATITSLDRDGRILTCNRALPGCASDKVVGTGFLDCFPPADQPRVREAVASAFGGRPTTVESAGNPMGETTRFFFHSLAPLVRSGRRDEVVVVSLDITDRKRAEEEKERLQAQLVEARKMEALGSLATGISHDFNNLLTIVLGHVDLALLGAEKSSDGARALIEIRGVVQQAKDLTRQITALGRRQILTTAVLDLNRELTSASAMLRRVIGETIEIETRLSADLGRVRGDSSELQQVLLNLAVHARDTMPDGGKLVFSTANTIVREHAANGDQGPPAGEYVLLTVSDTGSGMDEEMAARAFEPYFTSEHSGRGAGISLATVFGIVKQHAGHIEVRSAPGSGTTFRIFLPRVEPDAQENSEPKAAIAAARGDETVLLVEDDQFVRDLVHRCLVGCGFRVLSAEEPLQALETARGYDGPIHLLLTDVVMPNMNGRALRDILTAERQSIKVLFMSGYAGDVLVRECGGWETAMSFIQKPFKLADLTRKIRDVLDRQP